MSAIAELSNLGPTYKNPVILRATCNEPEGDIVRSVRKLTIDMNVLKIMWEKSRQFDTLFNDEIRGDFGKFMSVFLHQTPDNSIEGNGLFWVVDNFVGLLYMTDIIPEADAKLHYTFYDKRQRGRIPLVKAMMTYVFVRYNFRRLTAEVPVYALHGPMAFIKELGFKQEGTKRRATLYNGKWYDVVMYGILREEI